MGLCDLHIKGMGPLLGDLHNGDGTCLHTLGPPYICYMMWSISVGGNVALGSTVYSTSIFLWASLFISRSHTTSFLRLGEY